MALGGWPSGVCLILGVGRKRHGLVYREHGSSVVLTVLFIRLIRPAALEEMMRPREGLLCLGHQASVP